MTRRAMSTKWPKTRSFLRPTLGTPVSPYKASVALAPPVFGYALGAHGPDWLDGNSVPQAMDILPMALTCNNLPQ